jgi:hypothetical protein
MHICIHEYGYIIYSCMYIYTGHTRVLIYIYTYERIYIYMYINTYKSTYKYTYIYT